MHLMVGCRPFKAPPPLICKRELMSAPVTDLLFAGGIRLDVDSTSFVILALFTLLFFTLRKLVFQPFLEDADARDEKTGKMRESATELRRKAQELSEQYATQRDEAMTAAQEARRALRVAGLAQKEETVGAAQSKAQANYQDNTAQLQASFEASRTQALSQADAIAKEIASKILGRAVIWTLFILGSSSYLLAAEAFAGSSADGKPSYLFQLSNQGASLLVFLGVVIYFAGGKIQASLQSRADELAKEITAAQEAHQQAKALLDEYEEKLAQLETEREELLAAYREQGETEKALLIAEGEKEAERVTNDAQRSLDNELAAMQRKIEQELVETSLTRAEELITKKINITDHNRLTQSYLSELDAAAKRA